MRKEMNHDECGHSHSRYGQSVSVKERVLARANYLCECCGEWAHSVYSPDDELPLALTADDMASAVAVCRRCLNYINENPITGQSRANVEEREAALADIYGQGSDSAVFYLLAVLEDCKQEHRQALT
jgi:hypothetical protein